MPIKIRKKKHVFVCRSSKLNPDIKILDALRDLLPMRWHERIIRTVDRLMAGDNAAIA